MMRLDDGQVRDALESLESVFTRLDGVDPGAREAAEAAIQTLVQIYGEALARIADRAASDPDGVLRGLSDDELIGHLMVLHDIHPVPVEQRVQRGLDEARDYLRSHGGDVELVGIRDDKVHVRLTGSCDGCGSSAATLQSAVEEAVLKAAPELAGVEAERTPADPVPAFVPLGAIKIGSNGNGSL